MLASADSAHGPAICAAWLLKAFAFLGIRPSLDRCCVCGEPLACEVGELGPSNHKAFSCSEGGVVCDACRVSDVAGLAPETLSWASALGMRFRISLIQVDQSRLRDAPMSAQVQPPFASVAPNSPCGLF